MEKRDWEKLLLTSLDTPATFSRMAGKCVAEGNVGETLAAASNAWQGLQAVRNGSQEVLGMFGDSGVLAERMREIEASCVGSVGYWLGMGEDVEGKVPDDLLAEARAFAEAAKIGEVVDSGGRARVKGGRHL